MARKRKTYSLDEMLDMPVVEPYKVRFIPEQDKYDLVNLYHLARTALSDKPYAEQSPYHRMVWASSEYSKINPAVSSTAAYKDLCGLLDR
jgi:hypothetical protein